ncbi:competence type IV pilus major pilin ComGC [Streptococcus cuniculipharyngis]|uniref:Prepilin-type N-terminal cleavage/methylation domain-containing protein n=1 Tax=Streptococcus cuniculipharyngis TaxID=1562651 RepID=A0A5C5SAV1_9STRE|nr:competence type IV pilus major pilin ComGC [Streptococcus cuniculipharyngis]TWS97371.1 prepilin-type N-terminal cleavage/methylation domain-containing protein [Streptococcus cuniculipharyngis]
MKKVLKRLKKMTVKGFTLLEMLVVLIIISVLLLLFVPNLSQQKDKIRDTGAAAIVKVVDSQAELYELNGTDKASLTNLVANGNITQKQADSYNEYYSKNSQEGRKVPN